jgi:hypothetical protein
MGKRTLALFFAAPLLAACSYVKPMSPGLRKAVAARDTVYVMPAKSFYAVRGFLQSPPDSARMQDIRDAADEVLPDEIRRAFPGSTVILAARGSEDSVYGIAGGATVVSCEVIGFERTLWRETASEFLNVLFMIPTFGMNLGYPLSTTSEVFLKIRKPGATKVVKLKHRDQVKAFDPEDLRFQIRVLLDPDYRA